MHLGRECAKTGKCSQSAAEAGRLGHEDVSASVDDRDCCMTLILSSPDGVNNSQLVYLDCFMFSRSVPECK